MVQAIENMVEQQEHATKAVHNLGESIGLREVIPNVLEVDFTDDITTSQSLRIHTKDFSAFLSRYGHEAALYSRLEDPAKTTFVYFSLDTSTRPKQEGRLYANDAVVLDRMMSRSFNSSGGTIIAYGLQNPVALPHFALRTDTEVTATLAINSQRFDQATELRWLEAGASAYLGCRWGIDGAHAMGLHLRNAFVNAASMLNTNSVRFKPTENGYERIDLQEPDLELLGL